MKRKRYFFALAASLFGLACAAYVTYASALSLDFLVRTKNYHFPERVKLCMQSK